MAEKDDIMPGVTLAILCIVLVMVSLVTYQVGRIRCALMGEDNTLMAMAAAEDGGMSEKTRVAQRVVGKVDRRRGELVASGKASLSRVKSASLSPINRSLDQRYT